MSRAQSSRTPTAWGWELAGEPLDGSVLWAIVAGVTTPVAFAALLPPPSGAIQLLAAALVLTATSAVTFVATEAALRWTLERVNEGRAVALPASRRRWRGRPLLASLLRGVLVAIPAVVAVSVSYAYAWLLPPPEGTLEVIATIMVLVAMSGVVLVLVDDLTRRALPLVALLQLSLLFPEGAPSRYKVARRAAGIRTLEERVAAAHAVGQLDEPAAAAEQILALVAALRHHDGHTRGHSERVRVYTDMLADELGLNHGERDRLRWAALLHDVGKLAVSSETLNQPRALNDDEWEEIKRHPLEGARLAAPLMPWLGRWGDAIEQHHERWDGGGYPYGLTGDNIGLAARIVSVADAYETMTAARPYRPPLGPVAARQELAKCAGGQFDPAVVRAFFCISIGRLRWEAGPLALLLQTPVLRETVSLARWTIGPGVPATAAAAGTALVIVGQGLPPAGTADAAPRTPEIAITRDASAAEAENDAGSDRPESVATRQGDDRDPTRSPDAGQTPTQPGAPERNPDQSRGTEGGGDQSGGALNSGQPSVQDPGAGGSGTGQSDGGDQGPTTSDTSATDGSDSTASAGGFQGAGSGNETAADANGNAGSASQDDQQVDHSSERAQLRSLRNQLGGYPATTNGGRAAEDIDRALASWGGGGRLDDPRAVFDSMAAAADDLASASSGRMQLERQARLDGGEDGEEEGEDGEEEQDGDRGAGEGSDVEHEDGDDDDDDDGDEESSQARGEGHDKGRGKGHDKGRGKGHDKGRGKGHGKHDSGQADDEAGDDESGSDDTDDGDGAIPDAGGDPPTGDISPAQARAAIDTLLDVANGLTEDVGGDGLLSPLDVLDRDADDVIHRLGRSYLRAILD